MYYKTKPLRHQQEEVEKRGSWPAAALLWDAGVGKTKTTLDNAAFLFLDGKIDTLVVVAPPGLDYNWLASQAPQHLACLYEGYVFSSSKARLKSYENTKKWLKTFPRKEKLLVVAMSYDSVLTEAGHSLIEWLLHNRVCMLVLDESQKVKNPGAKRTKRLVPMGRYAAYRRILSWTQGSECPFEHYAPFKFLDEEFWKARGIGSYAGFQVRYGEFRPLFVPAAGRTIQIPSGYRNLPELKTHLSALATWVLKSEVLDLPPKTYTRIRHPLGPIARRAYDDLVEEYTTQLQNGEIVTADHVLTRMLRLQQICSGYLSDTVFDEKGRVSVLLEFLEGRTEHTIIWARFRQEIDFLCNFFKDQAFRYDGAVSEEDRVRAVSGFQAGERRFFIANPQCAGMGLTLTRATTAVYLSRGFSLNDRLQSEERFYRIGQKEPVEVVDFIAEDTIDELTLSALERKLDLFGQMTPTFFQEALRAGSSSS